MKYHSILDISFKNLWERRKSNSVAMLGIIIGIVTLIASWALVEGVKNNVVANLADVIAPDEIIVTPEFRKVYFMFETESKKSAKLNQSLISELREKDYVTHVYPEIAVSEAATATINYNDKTFVLDAPLFGMPAEYFENIPEFESYSTDDEFVPAILSNRLFDIYNLSYASSDNFLRLNKDAFLGLKFDISAGYSSFYQSTSEKGTIDFQTELVGFGDNVPIAGLVIPYDFALEINEYYLGEGAEPEFSRIIVKVTDPAYVPEISEFLKEKNLTVQSLQEELSRFNSLVRAILLSLTMIIFIILLVSAFNIFNTLHAAVLERKTEIGLWKACGATNPAIGAMFFFEAVFVGFIGGCIGVFGGYLLARLLNTWLQTEIPEISLLSREFIQFEWYMFVIAILSAAIIAGLAGFGPAKRAARLYPVEVLRG